jgi:hypothetical protein
MPDADVTLKAREESDRSKVLEALRTLDMSEAEAVLKDGGEGDEFAVLRFRDVSSPDEALHRAGEIVREAARVAGVPEDRVGAGAQGFVT